MKDSVKAFFEKEKIEYYSILDYSACREINPGIVERMGFEPRSVILYLLPYYTVFGENISSYAVGVDYHLVIKRISSALADALSGDFPENRFAVFGDHSPIDERHAATVTGLGILGDSGLLINEKYGSYVFIGELISDLALAPDDKTPLGEVKRCISCGKCRAACPTGILCGKGDECLSAITQKKGELSASERALMINHGTAWGCDVCQRACPYNEKANTTPIADFYEDMIPHLTKATLDAMDKPRFERRAYAWRGRKTIERNLILLENANISMKK